MDKNVIGYIRKHPAITALLISISAILALPQILKLQDNILVYSQSVIVVIIWFILFITIYQSIRTLDLSDKRGIRLSGMLSFFFSLAMFAGSRLDTVDNLNLSDWGLWISLPILTVFFMVLLLKCWQTMEIFQTAYVKKRENQLKENQLKDNFLKKSDLHYFLLTAGILFLCWLPVFLAVYPGSFVYDAQDEYVEVAARVFSTHHPLAHVLLLGGMICGVHKVTGSYNLGIACYTIFQMLVLAGSFAYLLSFMRKRNAPRYLRLGTLIFFGFFPVIPMYAVCSAKDTLFSAAFLLILVLLLEAILDEAEFFSGKSKGIFLFGASLTMMLFRNNGLYAFIVFIPIVFLVLWKRSEKETKKKSLRLPGIMLLSVLSFFLVSGLMSTLLKAENSEKQEMLTVPIQQLARVYTYEPEIFSKEEETTLFEVLPKEVLEAYNPRLSDLVKSQFDSQKYAEDPGKYQRLWMNIALRKPMTYLNAWFMTSYGYWYPDTVINVYGGQERFTFSYKESSYFGFETEPPGERDSKFPWLEEQYRRLSLELYQQKIPLVSMLFSPGFLFWIYLFLFFYLWKQKQEFLLLPMVGIGLLWLTVILGPTYLVRYVLILWFALPLIVFLPFLNGYAKSGRSKELT